MERSLEYDLEFFYNQPKIVLGNDYLSIKYFKLIESKINSFSKLYKKFYILIYLETIRDSELLDNLNKIINRLNDNGFEIYLSMNTTTIHKNYLHPICNCIQYKNYFNRISNDILSSNIEKKIKGMISVRRQNRYRNLFFNKYNGVDFDGIFRYLNVNLNITNSLEKSSPTLSQLIIEIKKSFTYFIFETDTLDSLNSFTEKTMLSFLNLNLPFVFLTNKNHLKELEDIGFYIFNRDIGYYGIDGSEEDKVNEFIKYLDIYNQISLDDLKTIYTKNYEKILNNYKLINTYIFSKQEFDINENSINLSKRLL